MLFEKVLDEDVNLHLYGTHAAHVTKLSPGEMTFYLSSPNSKICVLEKRVLPATKLAEISSGLAAITDFWPIFSTPGHVTVFFSSPDDMQIVIEERITSSDTVLTKTLSLATTDEAFVPGNVIWEHYAWLDPTKEHGNTLCWAILLPYKID